MIEVVNEQLKVIKKREPIYNSYITVMEDEAREQAKLVQERIDLGDQDIFLGRSACGNKG